MMRYFVFPLAAVFWAFAVFAFNPEGSQAFDKTGGEMDCQKCHTITNQDVNEILRNLRAPEAEIVKVQVSPMKWLWEVSVINKGRPGLLYVDFSKNYVILGSIIEVKTGKNKTMERVTQLQESQRVDFSKIPLGQALVMGEATSPRKVAVFTDPDCPYCATLHQEMEKVLRERKDIVFYVILFPLPIHKDAYRKSKSIYCGKSLKMLEEAFAKKNIPQPDCDPKEIDSNIKLAEALGITGTPTLVLPDGRIHSGTMPAKQLIDFIQGNQGNQGSRE